MDGALTRRVAPLVLLCVLGMHGVLPGVTEARARVARVWVPVLIYHHVQGFKPSDDAIERGLTILPDQFDKEINYLLAHHFHVMTAAQVVQALIAGRELPPRPVVLTFDDGYSDMARTVVPELRRHHLRATFFIAAGLLGKPRYLTWTQVEAMAREGMDLEGHSMTHPDLTLVPLAQVRGEIYQCRQVLQSRLHRSVRIFAYPYGDYDAYTLQTLRRAGFEAAFTTHQGWWLSSGNLLTLPRVYVDNDDSLSIFAGRLTASRSALAQDPA